MKKFDFNNEKVLSMAGTAVTLFGLGISFLGNVIDKKVRTKKIEEEVRRLVKKEN